MLGAISFLFLGYSIFDSILKMFDPVPDDCLFVLPVDQFDLIGGQQQNQLEIIVDKNRLDDVTWFADRPERKSGVIAAKKFSKFKFWEKSFGTDLPNASLSWFTKNGRSRSIPFEMERPILDRVTGEYVIHGELLSGKLKNQGLISNAYIFIDASNQNQSNSSSSSQMSETPKLGTLAQDTLDGVGAAYLMYRGYTAIRAGLQAAALRSRNQILDDKIEELMGSAGEELFNEFKRKMDSFTYDVNSFGKSLEGERVVSSYTKVNFKRLQNFIKQDEFASNIAAAYQDKLEELRFSEFSKANFKKLEEALRGNAVTAARRIYDKISDLYTKDGPRGVFDYYTNTLDVTADQLLANREIFGDFSALIKAEREDVALTLRSALNQIKRVAESSGWNLKTGLEVGEVNEITSQARDQLVNSSVLDEQALQGEGVQSFLEAEAERIF